MYTVVKKNITTTGLASLGWRLGRGYVTEKMSVKCDKWCVMKDDELKPFAVCRSQKHAQEVAAALNAAQ